MQLRIDGKKEGIRLDFMDSTLEYLEKSLSNLIWGRKRGRKRIHFVVIEVSRGSFVFRVDAIYRSGGEYRAMDLTKEIKNILVSAFDLFEAEDPKDLIPYFEDEYGIERIEIDYGRGQVGFGLEEIKRYERKLKKSYGSITGIVTSIRLTKPGGRRVEAGVRWILNPERHIRMVLDEGRFKRVFLDNFEKVVRITGMVYYNREGVPFRIERVLNIEPVRKVRPDIDKLIGIIELEEDSVESVRKLRGEYR